MLLSLTPAYGQVSGERIRQQVIRHIEQSMPWPRDAVRIDISVPPDISGLVKDRITIRVDTVGSEEYVGEMSFLVRVSDGRQQRQVTVRGRLEILRDIAVAARTLERDDILSAADIKIKKKWVRNIDPKLIDTPDQAVGKRVVMSLKAGAELKTALLKEPVVVKRGRNVRINLEKGAMLISTMGVSEEDGAAGSMIRVRNLSSNRTIYAKVMDSNNVRIEF